MYKLLFLIYEGPSVRPKMFIRITVVEVLLVFRILEYLFYIILCSSSEEPECGSQLVAHTHIFYEQ